ncbi:MAG: hypothetical protein DDT40_00606 [candidate division WS2 bacterium]|nr:hypothetical protein [Candidatus Psychracetigena formicireducens]
MFSIQSSIKLRLLRASSKASFKRLTSIPTVLLSNWIAVTPVRVPATLKSISPKASSIPCISTSRAYSGPSFIKPIEIPATGDTMGTPASIKARLLPHTEAIEVEPFDSKTSDTVLIV